MNMDLELGWRLQPLGGDTGTAIWYQRRAKVVFEAQCLSLLSGPFRREYYTSAGLDKADVIWRYFNRTRMA